MALDLNRWIEYAKARVTSAVGKSNDELDRLEAEREVELADKPWLASDAAAPTLEEAKARIEWEAEEQRRRTEASDAAAPAPTTSAGSTLTGADDSSQPTQPAGTDAASTPGAPVELIASDPIADVLSSPEGQQARLELDARQRAAEARLDEIRRELGVDDPTDSDGPKP